MLAKDMKIQSVMAQRNFIIDMMKKVYAKREDGNAVFPYKGIIYPENIEYFHDEGFCIKTYESERIIAEYGVPCNLFYPDEDSMLTEEEMMQSEKAAEEIKKANPQTESELYDSLFDMMFGKDKE